MQSAVAVGEGAMAAILGLSDDDVLAVCEQASVELAAQGLTVSAANFNAPGQVAIAGHAEAVEKASELARDKGAKRVVPIAMSVPSHCALMHPAGQRLAAELADTTLRAPQIPIYHNVDAAPRETVDAIREALVAQVEKPVQWSRTIRRLGDEDYDVFVECGPGRVLSGLNRRIDKSLRTLSLSTSDNFDAALKAVTVSDR